MADKYNGIFTVCFLLMLGISIYGGLSHVYASSSTNMADNSQSQQESLAILNMTNITLTDYRINFVYNDHNTSNFEGCYGLNYTVLTDKNGNDYMLDHATTDILGEKTDYSFRYPGGLEVVFDNNTDTDIYKEKGLYYVHEIRDDSNTVIKSMGNFTLNDESHKPSFVPTNWTFVYTGNHNTSVYEGDDGLIEVVTGNAIGNHEKNVRLSDEMVIGLMYYSGNSTDYYRYGFGGYGFTNLESFRVNGTSVNGPYDHGYYLTRINPHLPNGTQIKSFNIESK